MQAEGVCVLMAKFESNKVKMTVRLWPSKGKNKIKELIKTPSRDSLSIISVVVHLALSTINILNLKADFEFKGRIR